MSKTFSISSQHYLFNVQAFAHTIIDLGGDSYQYAFRDGTTRSVIEDVASGTSEIGVVCEPSNVAAELEAAFDAAGLEFTEVAVSLPRVALAASHPLAHAKSLSLDELDDWPYLQFEQEDEDHVYFEEALASVPRKKVIDCTDRATLSELAAALNGYTVTSGILVGITDGGSLTTVPLKTDVRLHLGYLTKKGQKPGVICERFIVRLKKALNKYAVA